LAKIGHVPVKLSGVSVKLDVERSYWLEGRSTAGSGLEGNIGLAKVAQQRIMSGQEVKQERKENVF